MNWLYKIFEKYYPCTCRKQAAVSSIILSMTLQQFCDEAEKVNNLPKNKKVTTTNNGE